MRLAGARWRTLVSAVRLGNREYRVVRPARPIAHAALSGSGYGAELSVDRATVADFAAAWWLAARSPRSLVYLPLRASGCSPDTGDQYGDRTLDLVLLHHSLGFPVSRWKQVRARLAAAGPHTVTLPPHPFPEFAPAEHWRRGHRGFHDHLRWAVAADTLFLIGSRHAYELAGAEVRALAEDLPARLAAAPTAHHCVEIGLGRWSHPHDRRNASLDLHIEYCVRHP